MAIDEKSGYFTDPALLARVPGLMLTLAGIYLSICFVACLMITEPQTCSTPELVQSLPVTVTFLLLSPIFV